MNIFLILLSSLWSFITIFRKKSTKSGIMSIFTHLLKKPEILIQFFLQYYIGNLPALAKNSVSALPGMHNIINLIR